MGGTKDGEFLICRTGGVFGEQQQEYCVTGSDGEFKDTAGGNGGDQEQSGYICCI